ncbi:transcription factor HY5 [Haematococcus lacustris]|uniref:Transcription factor HY5 n=1 Tax=Haematococcus lacustris TaxID=44745 RepID=A0A699YI81_HAELA|nr:transcription factor HY5 [Haematococcus lacustris]
MCHRQQLIAQKRAKGQAHKESLAVEKRQRVCTQQSEETEDSEDERMAAAGDPVKDKQKLKRLLRNRVSAQQARERKKQHLNELEEQAQLQAARIEQLNSQLAAVRAEADGMRRIIGSMKGASALPPGHHDGRPRQPPLLL